MSFSLFDAAAKRRHVKHVKTTCSYPKEPKSSDFASKSWSQCGLHDFGYPSSFAKISADSESSGHGRSKSIKNSLQLDPYLSGHVHLGPLKKVGPITNLSHIYVYLLEVFLGSQVSFRTNLVRLLTFLSRRELSLLFAGLGLLHGACRAKKVEKCHFSSKFVLIEIDAPGVLWAYGRGGPL